MNTDTRLFDGLDESRECKVKIESGQLIPFPIGQRFALNGYWFETIGVQNGNELILKGIEPTDNQKKKIEDFFNDKTAGQTREELVDKFKRELYKKK